jgi:hypothetical protein
MNKEALVKAGVTLAIVMVALAVHQKYVAPMIAKSNAK